ncbi:alpha/beta fold hydrolase [Dactylosporangium sp. NPDC000555]|uniref:alpha/beta fold hydrolase n=1 Tax=Dactylosporangium sp. NPDC000555 TaxID=3154260 RepID=UPI00331F1144
MEPPAHRPDAPTGHEPPRQGPPPGQVATMLAYTTSAMADPQLLRRLHHVPTPTLLVWGEDDHVVPPTFGRAYADAFPNSRFETIPGAGHITTRTHPKETLAHIDAFLA